VVHSMVFIPSENNTHAVLFSLNSIPVISWVESEPLRRALGPPPSSILLSVLL
jgi:hypothetical protein